MVGASEGVLGFVVVGGKWGENVPRMATLSCFSPVGFPGDE